MACTSIQEVRSAQASGGEGGRERGREGGREGGRERGDGIGHEGRGRGKYTECYSEYTGVAHLIWRAFSSSYNSLYSEK